MAEIDGGRLVAKVLKQEGVECLFMLCGGHIDPIVQGCWDEGIRVIGARHEQAAVFMAEGWAWATGKPGVAAVTAGPGVTNAVTGLWTAMGRGVPIVVFGGRSALREFERGSLQDMDSLSLAKTVTKWARSGYETKRAAEYTAMAFRQALGGRPGPAYLEFPMDVLYAKVDEEKVGLPAGYRSTVRPKGDSGLVKEAVDLLLGAERPLIVAGGGVWWSQAGEDLREFVEMTNTPLCKEIFPSGGDIGLATDHPLHLGIQLRSNRPIGVDQADVVLLLGARLDWRLGFGSPRYFSKDTKWIQVDIDATEIGHNRPVEIGIAGDVSAVLRQMTAAAKDRCRERTPLPWIDECREQVRAESDKLAALMANDAVPIHPDRLCKEVRDAVDKDATIIIDGGHISFRGVRSMVTHPPGQVISFGPTGTLGTGPSYGIAAKLARPGKQVLVISGDGSFGLNAMEFDTMIRHQIPVVCVIANDSAWGAIVHDQLRRGPDRIIETKLDFLRYDKVVEDLGGHGELVEKPEEVGPALERAFASGLPACVNVRCAFV